MCLQFSTTMQSLLCESHPFWHPFPLRHTGRPIQCTNDVDVHASIVLESGSAASETSEIYVPCDKLNTDLYPPSSGSVTSHTRWDSSIQPVKRITIVSDLCPTPRPTSSSCALASLRRPLSKTYARNGFPKSTTTALASLA